MSRTFVTFSVLSAAAVAGSAAAALLGAEAAALCLTRLPPVTPDTFWTAWSFAPEVIAPLAVLLVAYAWFWLSEPNARRPAYRLACFAMGFGLLLVALVSPLCRLSATLAAAHMIQHAILVLLAPPLLLLAVPAEVRARWLPGLHRPTLGAAVYGALIWAWHLPRPYDLAVSDPAVHVVLYATLMLAALWFWAQILDAGADANSERGSLHPMSAIVIVLLTIVHTGLLGALLVLSPAPWYATATGGPDWGLSPLEDQQLAGLVMWVPMAGGYMAAAIAILFRQLSPVGVLARD